jgi:hypothetical protein
MDYLLLFRVLAQLTATTLTAQGKTDQAGFLTDTLAALRAGKNVDDILRDAAERWEASGEPSVDDLVTTRKNIQARIDA